MKSLLVVDAAEYNAATNRISSALETLRDEMKSLRHQDVTLMRQFITMNDTIRSISKEQKSEKTRKKRLRNKTLVLSASLNQTTTPSWQIPLVRQQSVPRFCDVIPEVRERKWSCSSNESSECSQDESLSSSVTSLDDDNNSSDDSISSAVPVFRPSLLRQRSKSMKTTLTKVISNDTQSKVESILKSNVKLWKARQALEEESDSDNVFDSESSDLEGRL